MKLTSLLDRALFYLSVPKCVGCGARLAYGELAFCPECSAVFEDSKTRNCSVCSRVLSECDCSSDLLEKHKIKRVLKVFRYIPREENAIPNSLIFSLKQDNRRDVIRRSADELSAAIRNSGIDLSDFVITNIPRRTKARIKYGFDHSEQLAREIAHRFGATYLRTMRSKARLAQKSLHGSERTENIHFIPRNKIDLTKRKVLIVDDVITTGTSMSVAADVLKGLGASELIAASLSIAYKDKYVPFEYTEF